MYMKCLIHLFFSTIMVGVGIYTLGGYCMVCFDFPPLCHKPEKSCMLHIYISLHSCQISSPSETGLIVSAHRLTKITLLTLIATLSVVARGVADLYP